MSRFEKDSKPAKALQSPTHSQCKQEIETLKQDLKVHISCSDTYCCTDMLFSSYVITYVLDDGADPAACHA